MPTPLAAGGSIHPLRHIFSAQPPHTLYKTKEPRDSIAVDIPFYTALTGELLARFYPKYCCGKQLRQPDGNRHLMLRCPECHKQKSMLVGTPLEQMKHPLWMFSYLVKEGQVRYPAVLTTSEIGRRLGVSMHGAKLLKRRIQLFASDVLPRMKEKVYQDLKTEFAGFNLPDDRNTDLTELVRDRAVPQTDVVVLYSCAATANKGRKRFKRKGQTASIYRSESLGGDQVGTMVNTFARKQGPVFYDSVSDQQASTLNPLLKKLMPVSTPLFTDMGYRGFPGRNHRMVNHGARSKDKRYRYAKNRWSKNGVHSNVAEGKNSILKRSFGAYVWVRPENSTAYLNEYSFFANLRHFDLDSLLPKASVGSPVAKPAPAVCGGQGYQCCPDITSYSARSITKHYSGLQFKTNTLPELDTKRRLFEADRLKRELQLIPDDDLRQRLRGAHEDYSHWTRGKTTKDQRRKQRYYLQLAERAWPLIPRTSFVELHDLAGQLNVSGKHLFRIIGVWIKLGLVEGIDLNTKTKAKHIEFFDLKRKSPILLPISYIVAKENIEVFNASWRVQLRTSP